MNRKRSAPSHPIPGVVDTLNQIRDQGLPMGIITDAHSRDAVMRLEKAGLLSFFCCMVTYDLVRVKKPAHEPFITALDMLQSTADEVLLVGDSPRRDIEPGKTLGFRTVYARYGDRFSDDRSSVQADYTIDSLAEFPEILSSSFGIRTCRHSLYPPCLPDRRRFVRKSYQGYLTDMFPVRKG